MTQAESKTGLPVTLYRLLASLIAIGRLRMALLGLALELEKRRLFDALLWAGVALLLLFLGLVLLCGLVLLLVWDGHRLWAVGGMTVLSISLGVAAFLYARRCLRTGLAGLQGRSPR